MRRAIAGAILTIAFCALGLSAGTLGPTCASCYGGVYSLGGFLLSSDSTAQTQTYELSYSLDLSKYTGPSGVTEVDQIAAKVVSGPNLISSSLVSGPTGGSWTQLAGNLNSNGCTGSGGGWLCLSYVSGEKLVVGPTGTNSGTWIFDVTVKNGTLMDIASIQANFNPATGVLMSEKIGVPEGVPGELPLLLVGLGLIVAWRRYSPTRVSSKSAI
jgi:hypothetical protein